MNGDADWRNAGVNENRNIDKNCMKKIDRQRQT